MSIHPSLKYHQYTKITLGASFNDVETIKKIVFAYSLAGADCFDIGAREGLLRAAQEAIEMAADYCRELGRGFTRPRIIVSVDLSHDPHFRKAVVTEKDVRFDDRIRSVCPTEAIKEDRIIANLCIGCGNCIIAPYPIKLVAYSPVEDLPTLLETLVSSGADGIEYHLGILPIEAINKNIGIIRKYMDKDISFSIGSQIHDASKCRDILDHLHRQKIRDVLIQVDGKPMSASDEYNSSMDSILLAKTLMEHAKKKKYKFYFQLSGGTNQYTRRLAMEHDISPHGIGWGTYARRAIADAMNIETEVHKAKGLIFSWRK